VPFRRSYSGKRKEKSLFEADVMAEAVGEQGEGRLRARRIAGAPGIEGCALEPVQPVVVPLDRLGDLDRLAGPGRAAGDLDLPDGRTRLDRGPLEETAPLPLQTLQQRRRFLARHEDEGLERPQRIEVAYELGAFVVRRASGAVELDGDGLVQGSHRSITSRSADLGSAGVSTE